MDRRNGYAEIAFAGTWRVDAVSDDVANVALSYPASLSNISGQIAFFELGVTRGAFVGDLRPVRFELRREAGTFVCEGTASRGNGEGTFRFEPDDTYAAALKQSGMGALSLRNHVVAGLFDLPLAFARAVLADFPTADVRKLMALRHFPKMRPSDGFDLHALHVEFPEQTLDDMLSLAMTGVTHDYVDALRRAGVGNLNADNVAALRASGVDRAFVERLAANGPHGLSIDDVVRRRDAGGPSTSSG